VTSVRRRSTSQRSWYWQRCWRQRDWRAPGPRRWPPTRAGGWTPRAAKTSPATRPGEQVFTPTSPHCCPLRCLFISQVSHASFLHVFSFLPGSQVQSSQTFLPVFCPLSCAQSKCCFWRDQRFSSLKAACLKASYIGFPLPQDLPWDLVMVVSRSHAECSGLYMQMGRH
jgi:hypothetical protein